ncbi:squalene/phytoene synthase family protein [Streptomyces sp. 7-21]|uniref:phytoene/squalene synthase family protein n=1 Tax=Streptomyces sp. 7-21 TaxID=2802283 RepID=UPI00191CA7F4|nr:squalene/phytoene synthase family protein [Streptomyces sp. 7-21]MBL1067157.1 squalene/phytoene synthase family protein [Streptomyces sp. 7-21]
MSKTTQELDAAGIRDPGLRQAYAVTTALFRDRARKRFSGRLMFPPAKRPYFDAHVGFVVYLDDLVDDPTLSTDERERRVTELETAFRAAESGETAPPPATGKARDDAALARAYVHTIRTWDLSFDSLWRIFDGQRKAVHTREYATRAEIDEFIDDVTLPPAVMINQIFEPLSDEAEELCRQTITSFQLLDFLWDLHEDLELGRIYLPTDQLRKAGLDLPQLRKLLSAGQLTAPLRELLQTEIDRARTHLDAGRAWPGTLHPTSRPFMELDIEVHDRMIAALTANDYAFFRKRRPGLGFSSVVMVPRTLSAISRARRIYRRAERDGYRVRAPHAAGIG